MSDAIPFFQHEPLNLSTKAIRVFQISGFRGVPADRIDCQLHHRAEPKGHVAVSYEWGTSVASYTIFVNLRPLKVGENLFRLLQRLKSLGNTEALYWIDAICIDQSNVLERNHQVQQMRDIYSHASQVICWLGDGLNPCIDEVSNILEETCIRYGCSPTTEPQLLFGNVSALLERQAWNSHEIQKSSYHGLRVAGKTGVEASFSGVRGKDRHRFWEGLRELCHASYWKRAWIIQEFLLNANCRLLYGNTSTDAQVLSNFLQGCVHYELRYVWPYNDIDEPLQDWPATRLALQRGNEEILAGRGDLHDLLRSSRNVQCSDRRDRVYSLLSLCRTSLSVNYQEPAEGLLLRIWASSSNHSLIDLLNLMTALSVTPQRIAQRCLLLNSFPLPRCRLNLNESLRFRAPATDLLYHQPNKNKAPWDWACSETLFEGSRDPLMSSLTFCQCSDCSYPTTRLQGPIHVRNWADSEVIFIGYKFRDETRYSISFALARDWKSDVDLLRRNLPIHVFTPRFLSNPTPKLKSLTDPTSKLLRNLDQTEVTFFANNAELTLHVKVAAELSQFLVPEDVQGSGNQAWNIDQGKLERHMNGHEKRLKELQEERLEQEEFKREEEHDSERSDSEQPGSDEPDTELSNGDAEDRRRKWYSRALERAARIRVSSDGKRLRKFKGDAEHRRQKWFGHWSGRPAFVQAAMRSVFMNPGG